MGKFRLSAPRFSGELTPLRNLTDSLESNPTTQELLERFYMLYSTQLKSELRFREGVREESSNNLLALNFVSLYCFIGFSQKMMVVMSADSAFIRQLVLLLCCDIWLMGG